MLFLKQWTFPSRKLLQLAIQIVKVMIKLPILDSCVSLFKFIDFYISRDIDFHLSWMDKDSCVYKCIYGQGALTLLEQLVPLSYYSIITFDFSYKVSLY